MTASKEAREAAERWLAFEQAVSAAPTREHVARDIDSLADAFDAFANTPPALDRVLAELRELAVAKGCDRAAVFVTAKGNVTMYLDKHGEEHARHAAFGGIGGGDSPDAALRRAFPEWRK